MRLDELSIKDSNIDLDEYLNFYKYVRSNMEHPEWLGEFAREDIIKILENKGKIWIYYDEDKIVCSVFYISSKNKTLNKHNIPYDETIVGSCGPIMVSPDYVGNRLQFQMLKMLDEYCKSINEQYIFTKIHPDNYLSINNFLKDNYEFIENYESSDGPRNVYLKRLY